MVNLNEKIGAAMVMAGLSKNQITQINDGAQIFGDKGLVDSLTLVRLISAISTGFEELDIDMFDMMADLDVEAMDAFAYRSNLYEFLERVISEKLMSVA